MIVDLPSTTTAAVSVGLLVPTSALVGAKLLFSPTVTAASFGILAFVALTATVALITVLTTNFSPTTVVAGIVGTVTVAFGYVAFLQVFATMLEPAVTINAAPALLIIAPALALLAVQLLARNPRQSGWLRDILYTRSVSTSMGRRAPRTGATA